MDRDRDSYRYKRPSTDDYDNPYKKQRTNSGSPYGRHQNDSSQRHHGYNGSSRPQNPAAAKKYSTPVIYQGSPPTTSLNVKDLPPLPPIAAEFESCVFTHPSLGNEELKGGPMLSYDKLEFLGDAYIEIIASRLIFSLGDAKLISARMSQIREGMVKNETLSSYLVAYGLDKKLNIPNACRPAERKAQLKINGDVFEAYVAAVVLSDPKSISTDKSTNTAISTPTSTPTGTPTGVSSILPMTTIERAPGYMIAEAWLNELWTTTGKLQTVTIVNDEQSKGLLQSKISGKGVLLEYKQERERIIHKGTGMEQYFVGIYLTGWGHDMKYLGSGDGISLKKAGMAAAKDAMVRSKDIIAEIEERKAREKRETEEREARKGEELRLGEFEDRETDH